MIENYLDEFSLWGTKQGLEAKEEKRKAKELLAKNKKNKNAKNMLAAAKKKGRSALGKKLFTVAAIGGAIDAAVNKESFNLTYNYTPRSFVSKDERIEGDSGETLKLRNKVLNIDRLKRALVDLRTKEKSPSNNVSYHKNVDPFEGQVGNSQY